ncbi:glutathione S-transferase T3-like [Raphanus sativus]|uniref:Glutathione S-transferase T3-like n=1 Tax=Raphanus sativus TaxID=3726 RepID=A0A6J0L2F0_RAPSA|nr:glutathione S-transferase T3-like [Raphanus sativus]
MQPSSLTPAWFVNLLTSQTGKNTHVECSQVPKPSERRKWSPKEDIVLISAWLNTSKDPIVSTDQKAGAFWKRIEEYYNGSPQLCGFAPRELNQCKQRWGILNEYVCRFVGSYEAALKEQASGQKENDVMKAAPDIYLNDYGSKFGLEHAWRELRYDQKWKSNSKDSAKDKRKEAAEVEPEFKEVRHPGVKAAKRKKRGNEAYDQLQTMLGVKDAISKRRLLERHGFYWLHGLYWFAYSTALLLHGICSVFHGML